MNSREIIGKLKITIGRKLGVLVSILLFLFLILGISAYTQIRRIEGSLMLVTEVKEPTSAAAYEMEIGLTGIGFEVFGYLHDHDKNRLEQIKRNMEVFAKYRGRHRKLADTEKGGLLGVDIDKSYGKLKKVVDMLIAIEDEQAKKMDELLVYYGEADQLLEPGEYGSHDKLTAAMEMKIDTNGIAKSLENYLRSHRIPYKEQIGSYENKFKKALAAYRASGISGEERAWLQKVDDLFSNSTYFIKMIIELDEKKKEGIAEFIAFRSQLNTIFAGEIRALTSTDLRHAEDISRRTVRMATIVILVLAFAGILIGFLASSYITRSITVPVKKLKEAAMKIGGGQLDTAINIDSGDEIGDLAKSFGRMAADLKHTQSILIQTEKLSALGELGAGVAHELNNPLTGVMSMVKAYMKEKDPNGKEYEDLKVIDEACRHMAKIVEDFTAFARPSTEEFAKLDCNDIIRSVLTFASHTLKKKDIDLVRNFDPALPAIKGNKNQLQQVVANMISNARDAIGEKGTITITTRTYSKSPSPLGDRVAISASPCACPPVLWWGRRLGGGGEGEKFVDMEFSDTGCGIKKNDLDKIFDPFFTTKRPGRGVGLGLSIVYAIIKAHKGEIFAESETGKGTRFTIRLPT